ncbi:MAG TPA: flagellar hook-associated protein FlgK [Limnobacter sp.]|uniref:flagellar hook-associated protein FlgK n=1 Tax=Limnobacter sp. TaxID=2003368 RepID=UPI002E32CED3|nr:flagellar hook-associated protein FlgK [Limnobacter sp.]HEX5484397.1 flagellar hook-associated protein FlgK [Limnobacter sp.]
MSNSIYGIALSGLNAAQAGLATTSNNISNSNTVGYTRQQVVQQARAATSNGDGILVGQGVNVQEVTRMYSDYLNSQLQQASSDAAFYDSKSTMIGKIDSSIGDSSSGLSTALSDFFAASQAVSANPADLSARQNFLSTSDALAARFNSLNNVMDGIRTAVNQSVNDSVTKINDAVNQLATLNKQIVAAKSASSTGSSPNDLMDQRDKLISDLAGQVQVTRVNLSDGSVNLFLSNGQPLVVKETPFKLAAQVDPSDPQNLLVGSLATINGQQRLITYDSNTLGTGALSGLLQFRDQELAQYQNTLGTLAAQVGNQVNAVQAAGVDLNNAAGQPIFSFAGSTNGLSNIAKVVSNQYNSTSNPTNASITQVDYSKLTGADYEVRIIGGAPQYREAGSSQAFQPVPVVAGSYQIQDAKGAAILSFNLSNAAPSEGDSFVLMPSRDGAANIQLSLKDPSAIAASSTTNASVGNNENMLAMNNLQSTRLLNQANGASGVSISDAFNQLVSKVGNKVREIKVAGEAKNAVLSQITQQTDGLSGVNMDEEAANLIKYQQAYQASSKVISLSKDLFNQILSIFN